MFLLFNLGKRMLGGAQDMEAFLFTVSCHVASDQDAERRAVRWHNTLTVPVAQAADVVKGVLSPSSATCEWR